MAFTNFAMNFNSYQTIHRLALYQKETGDVLSAKTFNAFGLPTTKSYIHTVRSQLQKMDSLSSICTPFENSITGKRKGFPEATAKVLLRRLFYGKDAIEFTTTDITSHVHFSRSTLSKAINSLIQQGKVEVVDANCRPKSYRWIPEEQPDPVDIFMKVYSIDSEKSMYQFRLALLPCHLNRSLCGLPYLGENLTIRIRERMDVPIMTNDEIACFEAGLSRLLPYVISSGGDFRIFKRRVEEEFALTEKIRKLLSRIDVNDIRRKSLEMRCLSESLISILESEQGKRILYDTCRKVCGDEIHREEVNILLPKITRDMCQEFPSLSYDESTSSLVSIQPIDKALMETTLTKTMRMYALKSEKPLIKVNVNDIYREATLELMRQGQSL